MRIGAAFKKGGFLVLSEICFFTFHKSVWINYTCVSCTILIRMHGALITLPAFISTHALFITK